MSEHVQSEANYQVSGIQYQRLQSFKDYYCSELQKPRKHRKTKYKQAHNKPNALQKYLEKEKTQVIPQESILRYCVTTGDGHMTVVTQTEVL